jgi:hypothetical protein
MPGMPPPYQSRKLVSFSKEWVGYSDDWGLIGIPVGSLLIAIGCGLPILVLSGTFVELEDWSLKTIIGSIIAFGLCLVFAACGFQMLIWNRTWLNVSQNNRTVWKIGGLFGSSRRSIDLTNAKRLQVCRTKDSRLMYTGSYAVAFSNDLGDSIEIYHAATYDLAWRMCIEINHVLGITSD